MTFSIHVGAPNASAMIFEMRRKGLSLPCEIVSMRNRDGDPCRVGWFSLTAEDRKKVRAWLKE